MKQIFRYLQGTDMGLYYTNPSERNLVGFADAEYMCDPHTGRSQPGYVFTSSNVAISWRSIKQKMSATSSNHAKILAIHETIQECIWLRSVTQHIHESCGISSGQESPTIVHKDNAACIAQLKDEYIKSDNQANLFTKALPTTTFKKLVHGTGMRRLNELKFSKQEAICDEEVQAGEAISLSDEEIAQDEAPSEAMSNGSEDEITFD
ncbi:hypothetical protein Tco_1062884 [Tanacetum coccineum]